MTRRPRRLGGSLSLFIAALAALAAPEAARACTVCANPPTEIRAERAAPRTKLRLELALLVGSTRAGDTQANDRRIELLYAYSPIPRLELSLGIPLLLRTIETRGWAPKIDATPGDLEVAATGMLWSFTQGSFAESLALRGGVKLPTAPAERDIRGRLLSSALEPGCNSVTPNLSIAYALRSKIWAFSGGGGLYFPVSVRQAPHAGESIRSNVVFEIAPARWIALRAGIATRFEPSGELGPDRPDKNSGGFVGTIVNELVLRPATNLEVGASVYSPALQFLHGDQRVETTFGARAAVRL